MTQKTSKPYGTWPSPLSPRALAGQIRLNDVAWAGDGETLVWLEGRDGRGVLVAQRPGDAPRDLIDELSARGGVGYGGGEFTVHDDNVYFSADNRLFHVHLDKGAPRPLTPAFGSLASPTVSPDGKTIVYVHTDGKNDAIGAIDADGKAWPTKLASGADFYMQPAWHPNGLQLAWIAWDHPQMPWSGTRLETAAVYTAPDGSISLGETLCLAGSTTEAVLQPTFSPDGKFLAYASDRSGWWQIYVLELGPNKTTQITHDEAEHGGPAWIQGLRVFAWTHDSTALLVTKNDRGISTLTRHSLTPNTKPQTITALDIYQDINQPTVSSTGNIAVLASASQIPPRIVTISADPPTSYSKSPKTARHASSERLPKDSLAKMQPISWQVQTPDGPTDVFGNYYAPTNQNFQSSGLPPAIITIHGGPTAQRRANFEPASQFFATRGFAVVDVNYRGSTGYGRKYTDALLGNWGITDVEDAVAAAKHLADAGLADPNKIVIMGGSAGGYTVLQALATHPGTFTAGVCLYGISNLFALLQGTHKFEAHYNDSLLGVLPEATQIFRDRSPLFHANKITDALAIYHGAKDQVVPLDQAEAILDSLTSRNVPHFFHVYPDEGHGWRKTQNIQHYYTSLLEFLSEKVIYS